MEKGLKSSPEILEGNIKDKGKQKIQEFEVGMSSKLVNLEAQNMKC